MSLQQVEVLEIPRFVVPVSRVEAAPEIRAEKPEEPPEGRSAAPVHAQHHDCQIRLGHDQGLADERARTALLRGPGLRQGQILLIG